MNLVVNTPSFCGTMTAPSSKSHTLRALICAALADDTSFITAPLISGDMESGIQVLSQLGVAITEVSNNPLVLKVTPPAGGLLSFVERAADANTEHTERSKKPSEQNSAQLGQDSTLHRSDAELVLDLGNSGSLLYFLGMILAAADAPVCLTGDESLRSRPVEPLLSVYRQAGIPYSAANRQSDTSSMKVPPLRFRGPLPAGHYRLDGPFSQPVTGLLFAAPLLNGMSRITVNKAGERPYLRMTCAWLRIAGIEALNRGDCYFEVAGGQRYHAFTHTIPGDWSSALFPLTAAVICNAALTLTNLDPADTQGDSHALSILQAMGADIRCDAARRTVSVFPIAGTLKGGRFDCGDIPDAVPILAAAAVFCTGETLLLNAGVCRFKECDRLAASAEELAKFGAHITQGKDFLRIVGSSGNTGNDSWGGSDWNGSAGNGSDGSQSGTGGNDSAGSGSKDSSESDTGGNDRTKSGGYRLHPARVCSRGDHRIAMMLAVTACGIAARYYNRPTSDLMREDTEQFPQRSCSQTSCIEDFDCVKISYPQFIEDMNRAGARFRRDS